MKFLPEDHSLTLMNQQHVNLEQKTPEKYFVDLTIDAELQKEVEATEGYTDLSEEEQIEAQRQAVLTKYFARAPVVDPFRKKFLGNVIAEVFKRFHITETSKMLDRMKDLRFQIFYSCRYHSRCI